MSVASATCCFPRLARGRGDLRRLQAPCPGAQDEAEGSSDPETPARPSELSRLSSFVSLQLLNFPFQQPQSPIARFCLLGVYYYYLCVLQTSRVPLAQTQGTAEERGYRENAAVRENGGLASVPGRAGDPRRHLGRAIPPFGASPAFRVKLAEHPAKERAPKVISIAPAVTAPNAPAARGRRMLQVPPSGVSPRSQQALRFSRDGPFPFHASAPMSHPSRGHDVTPQLHPSARALL